MLMSLQRCACYAMRHSTAMLDSADVAMHAPSHACRACRARPCSTRPRSAARGCCALCAACSSCEPSTKRCCRHPCLTHRAASGARGRTRAWLLWRPLLVFFARILLQLCAGALRACAHAAIGSKQPVAAELSTPHCPGNLLWLSPPHHSWHGAAPLSEPDWSGEAAAAAVPGASFVAFVAKVRVAVCSLRAFYHCMLRALQCCCTGAVVPVLLYLEACPPQCM